MTRAGHEEGSAGPRCCAAAALCHTAPRAAALPCTEPQGGQCMACSAASTQPGLSASWLKHAALLLPPTALGTKLVPWGSRSALPALRFPPPLFFFLILFLLLPLSLSFFFFFSLNNFISHFDTHQSHLGACLPEGEMAQEEIHLHSPENRELWNPRP